MMDQDDNDARRARRELRRSRLTKFWAGCSVVTLVVALICLWNSKKNFPKLEEWLLSNPHHPHEDPCASPPPRPHYSRFDMISEGGQITAVAIFIYITLNGLMASIKCFLRERVNLAIEFPIATHLLEALTTFVKFAFGLHIPIICFIGSEFAKKDGMMMGFFMLYSYSILFALLAHQIEEDFGVVDLLVAIALGFFAGSNISYVKGLAICSAVGFKGLIPLYLRKMEQYVAEDSVLRDIEPSLRQGAQRTAAQNAEGEGARLTNQSGVEMQRTSP